MNGAFYSDNDAGACAWLRELIGAGLVTAGVVDERSITDLRADDLHPFGRVHLFAGIGGWDHALALAGWPADRPVWTGSCPCQPFSAAGKRKAEGDARHLWPEFRRLIALCRPATVFGEQVASRLGREWLAGVRADLEALGYAVGAADLCAAGVGAPHIRQRLYWVAHAGHSLRGPSERGIAAEATEGFPLQRGAEASTESERRGATGGLADAGGKRVRADRPGQDASAPGLNQSPRHKRQRVRFDFGDGSKISPAQQAIIEECGFWPGCERTAEGHHARDCPGRKWGNRRLGDAIGERLEGVEPARPAARPVIGADGAGFGFWSASDIIPCRDGKARRVEPGTFPLADGLPGRVGLLRGYGNAIVPQVAAAFIRAFLETEGELT